MPSFRSPTRLATCALCTQSPFLSSTVCLELSSAQAIAASPCCKPSFMAWISSSFSAANARHCFRRGSIFVSASSEKGTCRREQLEATQRLSRPASSGALKTARALSRSAFQILRPSITPTESTLSAGHLAAISFRSSAPLTASICKPATGNLLIVSIWSAREKKNTSSATV